MVKKAIVHIGTHKTGSTSLQHFYLQNEEVFKNNKVYFPKSGRALGGIAHHNLAWELLGDGRFLPDLGGFADLEEELTQEQYPTIILSSEDFEFEKERGTNPMFLKEFFDKLGYELYVIAFVRPQYRYLDSEYTQLVKTNVTAQAFKNFVKSQMNMRRYNYYELFKDWAEVCEDNLIVLPFEKKQWQESFEVTYFENLPVEIDMDFIRNAPSVNVNERPTAIYIEIMRHITKIAKTLQLNGAQLRQLNQLILRYERRSNWDDSAFSGLDNELASQIKDHFDASNTQFAKEIMKRDDGRLFLEEKEDFKFKKNIYSFDALSHSELMQMTILLNQAISEVSGQKDNV